MSLWVPPKVERELQEKTLEHKAELKSMFRFDGGILDVWNAELKKVDPYLRLAQAREKAHAPGVKPGYYHLWRDNPGAPPWVEPLTGPQGDFVEPNSAMLNVLRASDLQNARVVADMRRRELEAERAAEKAKQAQHEERVEDAVGRIQSLTQTRVSMNDQPWSQNVAGKRGVKEKKA